MLRLKREIVESGVRIETLHTDNGTFSSTKFKSYLATRKQPIRKVYLNHHLHGQDPVDSCFLGKPFWRHNCQPLAHGHGLCCMVYNHMPAKKNGMSPNDICSRSKDPRLKDTLGRTHIWGAPTYVLDPKLQKSGVKISKWVARIRRGAFMGFSP
eukprot:15365117-Ditylum_brightwellii.AAC.3